ncbi:hypothetical protein SKAU_G00344420 [Synaphobranchus kaupii]|uniref:Uncharacterized protein n=1 Tax=Synaphobranchus kaupii TaxID=118154 RepID=A0A9Q1IHK5_SYNKA|nr:hypothetical protein SKAU_G00344420 [Synaphobranchus kaupii]
MAERRALEIWKRRLEEESEEEEDSDSDSDEDSEQWRRERRRRMMKARGRERRTMELMQTHEVMESRCLRGALALGPFGLEAQAGMAFASRSVFTPDAFEMETRSTLGLSAGAGIEGIGGVRASANFGVSTNVRSDGRLSMGINIGGNVGVGIGDNMAIGVGANLGINLGDEVGVEASLGMNMGGDDGIGIGVRAGIGSKGFSLGLDVGVGPVKIKMLGL